MPLSVWWTLFDFVTPLFPFYHLPLKVEVIQLMQFLSHHDSLTLIAVAIFVLVTASVIIAHCLLTFLLKKLIGRFKNVISPHQIRRLQCQDPRTVNKYNALLEQQYHHHNTIAKLEEFHKTKSDPISKDDIHRLIKIDLVSTQAVRFAENRCRKLRMGAKPWTPQLHNLGETINIWHLIIKKKLGKNISSTKLKIFP